MNDIIGDLLTRIRNAQLRKKKEVRIPSSKLLVEISKILKTENFIEGFEVEKLEDKPQDEIVVKLRYVDGEAAIRGLKRISKPGIRIYTGYKQLRPILNGQGVSILTTSKGLMTGKQARKEKVGGEVLCQIW
jgi:small subunit ribosomal protein S8